MQIRPFALADVDAVVALWNDCGLVRPWNDPLKDIERKLTVQPELFLVGVEGDLASSATDGAAETSADGTAETSADGTSVAPVETVVATAMVGYDGHRGWINYLAVSPAWQRRGYARQLMLEAEALLTARGCPKLNLQVRNTNTEALAFYRALGYAPDEAVAFGKRLIAD